MRSGRWSMVVQMGLITLALPLTMGVRCVPGLGDGPGAGGHGKAGMTGSRGGDGGGGGAGSGGSIGGVGRDGGTGGLAGADAGINTPAPVCGNGIVDPGETCEPPQSGWTPGHGTPLYCGYDCVLHNGCTDCHARCDTDPRGYTACACSTCLVGLETPCGDFCSSSPTCGNGVLDPSEQCDPPGPVDFPTCQSNCQSVPDGVAVSGGTCAAASPGAVWSLTPASQIIRGIAAVTPANVWRQSQNAVEHWDGTSWTAVLSGHTFTSIWASGANDVWVGGDAPLQHWDGSTWTTIALDEVGVVDHIWGTGPQDVWVAGRGLTTSVLHWDGSVWADRTPAAVSAGQLTQIDALGGTGPADVWLLGLAAPDPTAGTIYFGSVLHWQGTSWEPLVTLPAGAATTTFPVTLWAAAANDVWVAGTTATGDLTRQAMWHFDGTGWIARPDFVGVGGIGALWGSCANRVWAVGTENGAAAIWFFDGVSWTMLHGTTAGGSIGGTSANDVWFGGGGFTVNTRQQFGIMLHRHE